jgi:two-component system sensor histidine kinase KdpD
LDALAHEFKTPLATIVTAAGALRETGRLNDQQVELAELAETEASRLARLTSRLLRVARLDREEIKPQAEIIDLLDLVTNLVQQYSKRWSDRQFSVNKLVTSAQVSADPELIQLALGQLLDNAAKYSLPRSAIEVNVESQDAFVTVRVWNSGSLIPRGERQRIFERFYRGSETRHSAPGSGLGLYVARKIALAHGGNLELEAETPGTGTGFRLALPLVISEPLTPIAS